MPAKDTSIVSAVLFAIASIASFATAAEPVLKGSTERPLRYTPVDNGFNITNGPDSFNRSLYGGHTAFRADGGDKPEFSLYLPGRGGVVRVGLAIGGQTKWLRDAAAIDACYADGVMSYVVRDPAWPGVTIRLTAAAARASEALVLRVEADGLAEPADLLIAYGGAAGDRSRRDGDIGTETVPVSQYFALKPEHCKTSEFTVGNNAFVLDGRALRTLGAASGGANVAVVDAKQWATPDALRQSAGRPTDTPAVLTTIRLEAGKPAYFAVSKQTPLAAGSSTTNATTAPATQPAVDAKTLVTQAETVQLDRLFDQAIGDNRIVARQVIVGTPDPFINSAVNAMNIAADALWDSASGSIMHGGVAWRRPYLGWRGPYSADATGRHDRAASHLNAYFKKQNVKPIDTTPIGADEAENLARSEQRLHTNGDLTNSHYDMNLVAIDMFFRHLLWTGDLDYAKKNWPTIERHLAWEKRLFRRPFGKDGLPLYEAYACIWASDDLQYHGGGVTHASAYNYFHNTMAARVAELIGKDPAPYREEAALIKKAMNEHLWLADKGWFAEYKDLLGKQLVHPAAALWTHYTTIDSGVPDAFQAWQMCRYVDTQIPHIPVHGPGVPAGLFTLTSTNWMPYMWSINNVAMAEVTHTALADWQAGRPDAAFSIFKGALMDSMFLGQTPGNLHMVSFFDAYRQESQRDSGDPVGITWRALIEGLFGITPDALKGELTIKPGFPAEWEHAAIQHPDVTVQYKRSDRNESFMIEPKFAKPMRLKMRLTARSDQVETLTVNGQKTPFEIAKTVDWPQIEFSADAAERWDVQIIWAGRAIVPQKHGEKLRADTPVLVKMFEAGVGEVDPAERLRAGGARPVPAALFLQTRQGRMGWWRPIEVDHPADAKQVPDIVRPAADAKWETLELSSAFNDRVTQIFKNKYVSPRSPYTSLAMPTQGYGGWASNKTTPKIDDTGLRALGGTLTLPNGVPFKTPSEADAKNVLFVSQWDNYPREATVPLAGRAGQAVLLMAGTTNAMQSRLDNGEVIVTYADGTTARLPLRNPETWWPIEQDYFVDDFGFAIDAPLPMRVDLKTGLVRQPTKKDLEDAKRTHDGGAATVLTLPLEATKELKSLTVRAVANEVVIGLMGVTLQRP